MVMLRDGRRGFIDATVLRSVHLSRNFILPLWISHNFLVFEHQSLFSVAIFFCGDKLVMRSRTP